MAKEFTRADGSVLKSGYMASAKPKSQARKFMAKGSALPPKVDLRSQMTPIENQGQIGSCVANATAGAVEHLINVTQGVHYDVSRLFIYYNARAYHDCENEDSGTYEETAVMSLEEYGVCAESTWPYKDTMKALTTKPNKNAYNEAKNFKIKEFQQVDTDLDAWRSALAEGHPIIFGMSLFDSFDRQKRPGLVPMPSAKEMARESHSGHAMLCVGYSDPDRLFIVRNSWGTSWGDRGYCYIPYDYMMNEEYNGGDSWVLYSADPIDTSKVQEETWADDDDDESIVPDIDTAFSDMDDETWEELCDECGDYDIIYRIGGLYVAAAVMDEEFGDEEKEMAAEKLQDILKYFGVKMNAKKVVNHCLDLAQDEEFLTSSMIIFAKYLPDSLKLYILNDMIEIAGADGLDDEEEGFINDMAEIFDIEEGTEAMEFDDEDDDDYWDDDDEEYDEDDDEYDEDEEYDEDDEEYGEDEDDDDDDDDEAPTVPEALSELSEKEWDKINRKLGDHDLVERIVHLLMIAGSNDDVDEDVYSEIVNDICECCEVDTEEYTGSVSDEIDYQETLELFGRYLPENLKEAVAGAVGAIISDSEEELAQELAEAIDEWFD